MGTQIEFFDGPHDGRTAALGWPLPKHTYVEGAVYRCYGVGDRTEAGRIIYRHVGPAPETDVKIGPVIGETDG